MVLVLFFDPKQRITKAQGGVRKVGGPSDKARLHRAGIAVGEIRQLVSALFCVRRLVHRRVSSPMSNVYVHFSLISFPARYSVVNLRLESHSLRFREVIVFQSCGRAVLGRFHHADHIQQSPQFLRRNRHAPYHLQDFKVFLLGNLFLQIPHTGLPLGGFFLGFRQFIF